MTAADRENRDYLAMMEMLKKREEKGGGKGDSVSEKEADWAMGGKD